MKASTLLGLGAALVVGLVAVAGIRYSGILNRPTPVPPPKVEPVMVLIATQNLYAGTAATSNDVGLRPATAEELAFRSSHPDKVLPPNPQAAHLRILKRDVPANEMLKTEYFEKMRLPIGVGMRLSPRMRAVDVELPTERAAAGLLRLGEHVDVYLTSKVCTDPAGSNPRYATAVIASGVKIIVKRGVLFTLLLPVPKDEPVSYILAANPYRAALIEFSKSRGNITLVADSGQELKRAVRDYLTENADASLDQVVKKLEDEGLNLDKIMIETVKGLYSSVKGQMQEEKGARAFLAKTPNSAVDEVLSKFKVSPEFVEEEQRVLRFERGESSVTEGDLEEIFRLKPLPPLPQPVRVEYYEAGKLTNVAVLNQQTANVGGGNYSFFVPSSNAPQATASANGAKTATPPNGISARSPANSIRK